MYVYVFKTYLNASVSLADHHPQLEWITKVDRVKGVVDLLRNKVLWAVRIFVVSNPVF